MELVVRYLVGRMRQENMISEEDKEWYEYSLQIIIEKIIGFSTILAISVIWNYFLQTVVFLLVFSIIRNYSGGFHFRHFGSCYLFSTGIYLVFLLLFQKYRVEFTSIVMLIVFLIVLGIMCIGAVNNPAAHWNVKEQCEKNSSIRIVAVIIYCSIVGLKIAGIEDSFLWFMVFGICLSFAGLIAGMISNIKKYLEV